jgi:N-glycosidase YbiA
MIEVFRGSNAFLSNFHPCGIPYEGRLYRSTEAAFQSAKCLHDPEKDAFTTLSPSDAKRRGRIVQLRPDWNAVKDDIMLDLLRIKFADPGLAQKLRNTFPHELVEGNTWDSYWGQFNGVGENKLGILLMQVRAEL